ncbi:hypothetical protein Tco_0368787 [Tanacetum coccineum]
MITYGLCQRTTRYDKIQKNDLWLLSMFDARHQNGYANVAWVIARWMKRKGAGTQKESQICCGQFISKIARKCRVLTEDVVRSLSALIYYIDLDTTTLKDLIDSDVISLGHVPRSEYMAGVYSVPMQGAYNPPRYTQPQYDQYYQQYPPSPPQYQQQQQDDDEYPGSTPILSQSRRTSLHFSRSTPHFRETQGTHDNEVGSSRSKRPRKHETVEEVLLPQVHHEFLLWEGCSIDAKSRYYTKLAQLLPRHIYLPCVVNWDVLNRMGYDGEINDMLRIRLREAGLDEEIFTSVAWIRAFNINEPIYAELCHEFYSTYEFDEVCADDELQSKKIIKFRLGGRAHSLTLLEFARRLGLYQAVELEEEGFNVYFEGGLRSDDNFNAQDYWLSISREDNLGLSRSHTSTIRNPILRVIHKMITYGLCQRTTGYDKIQKNDLWLLSMFDARHQNGVLIEDVVRILSVLIYCRDLDMITLRDLIDSDGKLIPEEPQPRVPRVGIPRPLRASVQDLYDRMGRMEIRQEVIEQMEYRQSYHWDRYQRVFEHMAGVYSVPMLGAYNPPGYAQQQYDQYYQQYPPPPSQYPPQYQQQ